MKPLREAINSGRLGVITYAGVYVPWWRADEYYKDSWHGTWKLYGGGVADPAAITHENHRRNFAAFLDSLETSEDFWIDGREARKAVEVILAVYKSAKEQRIVKLA
jgi:predicted dehydrogenase